MICQRCNAEIPDSSNFCTFCGTAQEPEYRLNEEPEYQLNAVQRKFYLDIGKLLGDAFELYKRHFVTMCFVGLVALGVPLIFAILGAVADIAADMIKINIGNESTAFLLKVISYCLMTFRYLLQWYLILGAIRLCLYIARGGTGFHTSLMFPPFMLYLKMIGISIITACISWGIMLPAAIPYFIWLFNGGPAAPADYSVFLIVAICFALPCYCAVLWITTRLYLAPFFLADRNTGVIESLSSAWNASSGNFWMLLLTIFVLGILSFLGFFLCCVGIFLTIAFAILGGVLAYLQLTGQPNCLD